MAFTNRRSIKRPNRKLTLESLEDRRLLANLPAGYTETVLASNLTSPTTIDVADDGRVWVAYQDGRIEVIEEGATAPILAHQLDADGTAEHGLQGLELDPDFANNRYLYVYYTANSPEPHNRLSRLTVDLTTENTIIPGSEEVLLELPNLSEYGNPPWHIGGAVHVALDGTLRVQIGESQQSAQSQSLESPLGKVFRINPDGTIPTDNPYYDAGDGITWKDYIWASGLRNPFSGDLDPETGQYLIGDVGGGSWEEINDATQPGLNFGWPTTEGAFNEATYPDFTNPLYAYSHANGCSITGVAFNSGVTQFEAKYDGHVFFSEFCGSEIRVVDPDNPADVSVFATEADYPMNIEFGADGAMYYVSRGAGAGGAPGIGTGSIRKVQFAADVPPQIVIPPSDLLVSNGYSAEFTVSVAGTGPFEYQWQVSTGGEFVDLIGETGATLLLPTASLAEDGNHYRVVVTNALGVATSSDAVLTVTADTPPTPVISNPTTGAAYRAGDLITFSGSATDLEDGDLGADQLTWSVDFHHNVHSHPFIPPTSGISGGQFTVPIVTETDDDVWYRITLTVTDSAGLTTSTFQDVYPLKSDFVVETNLPGGGGQVQIDGAVRTAPYIDTGVENVERTISAPSVQVVDGTVGFFEQWIDGSTDLERTILTPQDDTAYVALYRTFAGTPIYLSDLPIVGTPENGWGPLELDTSNGENVGGDGNPITLNGVIYEKGLGVHAYSEVTYNLGGAYSRFISDIGVDDENAPSGSVIFRVLADGNEVFNSGLMTNDSATQTVDVSVEGINELRLIVETGGDGNGSDHADWADARLLSSQAESVVQVNFQLEGAPIPTDYLADVGQVFGDRGNGWEYGWSSDHTDLSRDRDVNNDQRLDTLVHFHQGQTWEIAIPDGNYLVTAAVGDAGFTSTHTLNVEGQNYFDAVPLNANEFRTATMLVNVSDGRLTLDAGDAAEKSTRINYITIATVDSTSSLLPYASADATLDGHLDLHDIAAFVEHWQASVAVQTPAEQVAAGDFDFSGTVDTDDWLLLATAWSTKYGTQLVLDDVLSSYSGDYDRNGVVEPLDYEIWKSQFGESVDLQSNGNLLGADGNLDGIVNLADYTVWRNHLGTVLTPTTPAALVTTSEAEAARNALLAGVSEIAVVGAPGEIAIFDPPDAGDGEGAFAVMHDGNYRPMVAAAIWGSGKIVAFGHNGYTNFNSAGDQLDTGTFYENSIEWTTGQLGKNQVIVTSSPGTRDWLQAQGFTNVTYSSNWQDLLAGADLLIAELGPSVSSAKQAAVTSFVQSGGGLITGGTGWGYKSLGHDLIQLDGNQILRQAGLGWADGFRSGTTVATVRSTEFANASQALAFVEAYWSGQPATNNQLEEAGEALQTVLDVLPEDHPLAIDIATAFSARAANLSATPTTPVSDPLDKAVLTWESNQIASTPAVDIVAHHTAEAIYGEISETAPRVTEVVTIDTAYSRWQATGLYVAPGELVAVTVPAELVGKGYKIRVNAHTDNISQRDSWERMPVVHRSFDIDSTEIQIANAFGGSIFIDLGGDAYSTPPNLGEVEITIDGAVRQPYFALGEHSDQEWIDTLREQPAPYAVFVADNLIIVQRASESVSLTTPTAMMQWWQATVEQQDFLAARPAARTGREIINVDVQNSAGAAHSGHPIQAYDKYWGNLADWDNLQANGSWGDFHELGHNHQRGWWTFDGDGEVTVNIFSNYNLENQAADPTGGWAWSADPVQVIQHAMSDVSGGGNYSSKSDRWSFWFQLADGFGWDAYRNVFAIYESDNQLNPSALPSNNQQEKDQWLVRWSNEVGYDMTQFMVDTWGLSVSQAAIDSVAALPDWMPLATTNTDFQIGVGESQVIQAASGGIGMDGVATFVDITEPTNGTLIDNGDGTYTYESLIASGTDSIVLTYQSSAGNTQAFTIAVTIGNGELAGDVNLDGTLDQSDVDQFIAGWRSDTTALDDAGKIQQGDLNLDGTTNFSDWAILRAGWLATYGEEAPSLAALFASPQPSPNTEPQPLAAPRPSAELAPLVSAGKQESTSSVAAPLSSISPASLPKSDSIGSRRFAFVPPPKSVELAPRADSSADLPDTAWELWEDSNAFAKSELNDCKLSAPTNSVDQLFGQLGDSFDSSSALGMGRGRLRFGDFGS